jgi:hypothetical protein
LRDILNQPVAVNAPNKAEFEAIESMTADFHINIDNLAHKTVGLKKKRENSAVLNH